MGQRYISKVIEPPEMERKFPNQCLTPPRDSEGSIYLLHLSLTSAKCLVQQIQYSKPVTKVQHQQQQTLADSLDFQVPFAIKC